MTEQPVMTNADIKGLLIVNMFRKKLTDKVDADMQAVCKLKPGENAKAQELFERISGRLAVADALDIITDAEYEAACSTLMALFSQQPVEAIEFGKLTEHYCKDYAMDETQVVFKVNVQERLNENFARCRQANIILMAYSDKDCLDANELIVSFAREFEIIRQDEYDKAMKMIKDYRAGKKTPDEFLMVPKQFYTKLGGSE